VTIPEGADENRELVLSTSIQLFGPIHLREKESGITQPYFSRQIDRLETGDAVQFVFNLTGFPELNCHKLEKEDDIFSRLEKAAISF
jgi:hypothetical protein